MRADERAPGSHVSARSSSRALAARRARRARNRAGRAGAPSPVVDAEPAARVDELELRPRSSRAVARERRRARAPPRRTASIDVSCEPTCDASPTSASVRAPIEAHQRGRRRRRAATPNFASSCPVAMCACVSSASRRRPGFTRSATRARAPGAARARRRRARSPRCSRPGWRRSRDGRARWRGRARRRVLATPLKTILLGRDAARERERAARRRSRRRRRTPPRASARTIGPALFALTA